MRSESGRHSRELQCNISSRSPDERLTSEDPHRLPEITPDTLVHTFPGNEERSVGDKRQAKLGGGEDEYAPQRYEGAMWQGM